MKSFAFFAIVTTLATMVMAGNYSTPGYQGQEQSYNQVNIDKAGFIHSLMEFWTRFYDAMREILPAPLFAAFDKFYTGFEHFFETAVPHEFYTAIINLWGAFPKLDAVFTPQFFKAVNEFFRFFLNFFTPHQFSTFVGGFFNAMPSITELIPAEFFSYVARFVQHIPFATPVLEQWAIILQQMVTRPY